MVQPIKQSVLKSLLDKGGKEWDELLPYIAMGYRMTKQKSLGFYGREPIFQARYHRGVGWDRPKASFFPGDFVLIKQHRQHMLDVPTRPHILRVVEVKPSGVLKLQGQDAQLWTEQAKNVAHCPLTIVVTNLYPERMKRTAKIHYPFCGRRGDGLNMLLCDSCQRGFHNYCHDDVDIDHSQEDGWVCKFCKGMNTR